MQLDMNLPNGDLVPGGAKLSPFNVTACYERCVQWNAHPDRAGGGGGGGSVPGSEGSASCDAWVATDAKPSGSGQHEPWCWLKSKKVKGGYTRKQEQCFSSAECRVGVPASEFPCQK